MSETIHIIPKNKREAFHFTREEFQGRDYFSVRIWYDAGQEYRPTQKGVSIPVERFDEFAEGIDALRAVLTERASNE